MASASKLPPSMLLSQPFTEPKFIYGTAWKKDRTKDLVELALENGFRAIDTAGQPKHYQEAEVGKGVRAWLSGKGRKRADVYIQTKYTTPAGQDLTNMPYDPSDPLEVQIRTSVDSSLWNLRPKEDVGEDSYLDCLLLHSPLPTVTQTIQAWTILETYVPDRIRALGISNVSLPVLKALYESSTVKPSVVQNRFYPQTRYDGPLRAFCRENGISYQSFWTLTGNPHLLRSEPVASLARAANVAPATALYAFVMDLDVVVLNGTTSASHMREDLDGIMQIRDWAMGNRSEWESKRGTFEDYLLSS